jgi:hypothetical protein
MNYAIHKQTCADGQAYRYRISDGAGHLRYVAEPTGLMRPTPTRLVEFFDPDHGPVGRIEPSDVAAWRRGERYEVFVGGETEKRQAVILERWRLVDILLLRLPFYTVQLGRYGYVARGSRYGGRFYELFRSGGGEREAADQGQRRTEGGGEEAGAGEGEPPTEDVKVGLISRPVSGPNYVVETDAPPLRQAPLVLAALVILIDTDLYA